MRESFFNLTWLIPVFPFLAFVFIVLFTNRNRKLSTYIAWAGIGLPWLLGWTIFFLSWGDIHHLTPPEGNYPVPLWTLPAGAGVLEIGFQVDTLTSLMLFMVPFVCLMIFIYSKGYMGLGTDQVDPRYSRFFAYISLFACGMLGLIVSDNLLTLFIFWEIMGLCSYLLIGFWYEKSYPDPNRITPKEAGLKAFLTTRVGDVIMLIGLLMLFAWTGSLTFKDVFSHETLHMLAEEHVFGGVSAATLIALLIFGGAVGKSAQFPLHVWLPDAMEGPTPVSALIHAATMVSAGVYLVARCFPLFSAVPLVEGGTQLAVVAGIGAFTAFAASTIALAQNDVKRVLAYSTISQLGYMIAALGIGAYIAAVFHLITHAFFKALLFLGSGSVIHGVEHGHHEVAHGHGSHGNDGDTEHGHQEDEYFDANDMLNMGGLLKKMPRTGWTFIIGGGALAGIVPLAGFWSKDEILAHVWHEFLHPHDFGTFWPFFVWLLLTLAAALTAFYTSRQICLTFLGEPRTEAAKHAHESPGSMTWPLMILAFFAIILGLFGTPWANQYHHFIGEAFEATPFDPFVAGLSTLLAVGSAYLGWLVYGRKPLEAGQEDPLKRWLGPVHTVLENKYYVDELYHLVFIRPIKWLSGICSKFDYDWVVNPIVNGVGRAAILLSKLSGEFDRLIVDGLVNLVGRVGRGLSSLSGVIDLKGVDGLVNGIADGIRASGRLIRPLQAGWVQDYLLVLMVTVVALSGFYLSMPWLQENVLPWVQDNWLLVVAAAVIVLVGSFFVFKSEDGEQQKS
jgi:NADH-quinone oxidoreductase subunit L